MSGPARIRGNKLYLLFGETPDNTDRKCETTAVTLEHEDADTDTLTFCDASEGGAAQPFFDVTFVQSLDSTSFWRFCWEHAGEVVPFTYAPQGNAEPTTEQPHFIGFVQIPKARPTIGGEAVVAGTGFTSELRLDVTDADGNKPGVATMDEGTTP
ncbi:hypothetical protein ACFT5B_14175 [Luteimicrobium sp. NPDC057192]|uniref:hypothetical protein n=1 Tax=Luteimicrobium sp. NPDC057192 TaxID=3346042 RepID=UPI0036298852